MVLESFPLILKIKTFWSIKVKCYYSFSTSAHQDKNRKLSESHSVLSDSLRSHGLYNSWNSPGQNTGVGSLSLLQGIFPTQGLNPGLLQCRQILYQLSYQGSPQILKIGIIIPWPVTKQKPKGHSEVLQVIHAKSRKIVTWFQISVTPEIPCLTPHSPASKSTHTVEHSKHALS